MSSKLGAIHIDLQYALGIFHVISNVGECNRASLCGNEPREAGALIWPSKPIKFATWF